MEKANPEHGFLIEQRAYIPLLCSGMGQNLTAFSSDGFYFLCEAGDQVDLLTALEGSEKFSEWGFEGTIVMNSKTSSPGQRKPHRAVLRVHLWLDTYTLTGAQVLSRRQPRERMQKAGLG